jgi:hypothetical protein
MPLGIYLDVSLAQAREGREQARKLLAAGVDPMTQRKAEKITRRVAVSNSFEAVARQWHERWSKTRSQRVLSRRCARRRGARVFAHAYPHAFR